MYSIRPLTLMIFMLICSTAVTAQRDLLIFDRPHLVAGMYNHVRVVDCAEPVNIPYAFVEVIEHYNDPELPRDSLSVTQPFDDDSYHNYYRFTVPSEAWRIGFVIQYAGLTDTLYRSVRPLVAVIKFGGAGWRRDSFSVQAAKAQRGLYAEVENQNIDARCPVTGFSLTTVRYTGHQTMYNEGGSFTAAARAMINRLEPGDLILFRQITYRCPGNVEPAKARDLIFTIY